MQGWFNIDTEGQTLTDSADAAADPSRPSRRHTHCAALQDDFHWWHTVNDESETSGKLLLVDTAADFRDNGGEVQVARQSRLIQASAIWRFTGPSCLYCYRELCFSFLLV